MKIKKFWIRLIFILLLFDTAYSFVQHYNAMLEGDLPGIVLPSPSYKKVLADPFGISVLKDGVSYPATNRYFAHQIMYSYFRTVPIWLQFFVSPIDSIYLSSAIIKTIIQVLLIYLLAIFITGNSSIFNKNVIVAMALIAPIFQATGYHEFFGIIDRSITYTMFYALSNLFILIFLLPFVLKYFYQKKIKFNFLLTICLLFLSTVIAFHSATNAGVVLVLCPFIILVYWWKNIFKSESKSVIGKTFLSIANIPKPIFYLFAFISMLCLYSFYIGTFNSENSWTSLSLGERYGKLLNGVANLIIFKRGQFLFFAILTANIVMVFRQNNTEERDKIIKLFWIVLVFAIVYTLLLPLGGYRNYRPWIIRRDTIMPVLMALMILYGMSTIFLYPKFSPLIKRLYAIVIAAFLIILTIADDLKGNRNGCERLALQKIAKSTENRIVLEDNCNVMSWNKSNNFDISSNAAHMLYYWNVTDEPKWYKWDN